MFVCARVCVNNIFLFTRSPLLFTVNHLLYEKKVDVSIQTHFLNTISLQYEKNIAFPDGTKHFDLHEAVLM